MNEPGGGYPPGADNAYAPWNQPDNIEERFSVGIMQTLSKQTKVLTDDYYAESDGFLNTRNTDWKEAYRKNDHYTPLELIERLKNLIEAELPSDNKYIKHLLEECEGWLEEETYIEET